MTTRRTLIKDIPALTVASMIPALPAHAATLQTVAWEHCRKFGTPLSGSVFRLGQGRAMDHVARHLHFDQDIDGTWCVWADCVGPGDDDDRPPEGAIEVYDPMVASFLEQLYAMIEDPVAFGRHRIGKRDV